MRDVDLLLNALHAGPADATTWLALADALEENGQSDRAELTRLGRQLLLGELPEGEGRLAAERRVQALLASGVPPCVPLWRNSIGMTFALVPAGTFVMGSPETEADRSDDEGPQHEVEITRPFYLGVFPVTQEPYERVMGVNPSQFTSVAGEDTRLFPVENVSWEEAKEFCEKLTNQEGGGRVYRLPTEAEWEYACRGGLASQIFHFGNTLNSTQANFDGNSPYGTAKGPYLARPCKVGSYKPNAFGLYDMHGNVWEWCGDWYDEDYYGKSPPRDPSGRSEGSRRVFRGGGWNGDGRRCRSAYRSRRGPAYRNGRLGFRVALVPPGQG
jgi:uncharacterized protein (TIGR02996 family)